MTDTGSTVDPGGCQDCGAAPADTWLGEQGPLCDGCFDAALAAHTGMPRLPAVPKPAWLRGPDGRAHRMRYRIARAPTGISLRLIEDTENTPHGGQVTDGYAFAVLGDHDADPAELVAAVTAEAAAEIDHCYLEPSEFDGTWQLAGDQVAGRFDYDPDLGPGGPHLVVVDGRPLSWEQLGHALASFEGWRFRLIIDDPSTDHREQPWP